MAMPIYMKIVGTSSGEIEGGCTVDEYVGQMQVRAIEHHISVPTDESTGMHTGKRVHAPMIILKDMDSASPVLYKAMTTHEELEVTLYWYRHEPGSGGEEHYFTTTLKRATLVSIGASMKNQYVRENQSEPHMEELRFAYHTIVWDYVPTGLEAQDSHSQTA